MKKVYVIKNRYVDSVTLMGVAVELTELPGVTGAESGMGTSQNVDLLNGILHRVQRQGPVAEADAVCHF